MSWVTTTVVALPVQEEREIHPGITVPVSTGEVIRKEPGEKITKKEMDEAGQTPDDIARLVKDGAIKEE